MRSKNTRNEITPGRLLSPYCIVAVVLLVGLGVAFLTYNTIQKNMKEYVRLYEDKGASLITSVEAGVRTDLRSRNSTIRLKLLLDEMADRPEIFFIAITFSDGTIMQSSFTEGQKRMEEQFLRRIKELPKGEEGRSIIYNANERQVFLAYREFTPLTRKELWNKLQKEPTLKPLERFMKLFRKKASTEAATITQKSTKKVDTQNLAKDISTLLNSAEDDKEQPVIYVGLDARSLRDLQRASTVQTVVTSSSVLLLAVVGFLSLYWAHRAQRSRRKAGRSQAMVQEVVYNLPDGLIVTDSNDQIVYMNELSKVLLHCDGDITAGLDAAHVLLPDLVPYYIKAREGLLRREEVIELSTEALPLLPVGVTGSVIKDEHDVVVGTVFLMRDLREMHNLQTEVERKGKLAAIGSLAAGVAHEIRNPLSSIKGGATYLKSQFSQGSAGEKTATIVIDEVERLNRVITDLIGLSRPSDLTMKPVAVASVIEHCTALITQEAELRDVLLSVSIPEDTPFVMLDKDRFSQVILNLCLNSLDAMDEGGELKVTVVPEAQSISVIVEDNGEGMDNETRERIFEPYFTTKSHGTGLGLSVVHKIIEAHNGIIRVFSHKDKGTRFVIQLPCMDKE
ncbi:ATP-binding protein [Halodesulfovibrio marinisediminis]|uniref:histidine kinase n=1 Tax=Halodesulfovibrio marinisediminis DSM 17456 TaxID=1121457 RepID=A0A1N6FR26_9BACT|nr:ATP-binding protein [Halodesulfovibrio marinisediminis]SIN97678.1 two-component system, NtrC family, sensor histidine kinase HydH [Halodesulfovibrio marinisediminis DSM 17456]